MTSLLSILVKNQLSPFRNDVVKMLPSIAINDSFIALSLPRSLSLSLSFLSLLLVCFSTSVWKYLSIFVSFYLSIYLSMCLSSYLTIHLWRKVRSRGICVSAMAKNVISHILYFNIFSNFLYKCYSISIIIIDFA